MFAGDRISELTASVFLSGPFVRKGVAWDSEECLLFCHARYNVAEKMSLRVETFLVNLSFKEFECS